jgi:hypothetical protein
MRAVVTTGGGTPGEVRGFVESHRPAAHTMGRAGVRAPDAEGIPALRKWTAQLFDAGYVGADWPVEWVARAPKTRSARRSSARMARARVPTPIGAGPLAAALIHFGRHDQPQRYLPRFRTRLSAGPNQSRCPIHAGITAFVQDMTRPRVDVRPLREITGTSDFLRRGPDPERQRPGHRRRRLEGGHHQPRGGALSRRRGEWHGHCGAAAGRRWRMKRFARTSAGCTRPHVSMFALASSICRAR